MIERFSLFTVAKDDSYTKQIQGDSFPFSTRNIDSNYFMFKLKLPPGTSRLFYLKLKVHSLAQFPIEAGTLKAFIKTAHSRDIFNGIFFGIIFALVFYNLFIFISVRDKSYLFYVFYAIFAGLFNAYASGYAFNFLWGNIPLFDNYPAVLVVLTTIFALLFAVYFLELKEQAPAFYRAAEVYVLLLLIPVIYNLAGYRFQSIAMVQILDFVGIFVLLYFGTIMFVRGQKHARFYMLAWSIQLLATLSYILKNVSVLPYDFFTANALQIGIATEAILLSFALADRINTYKLEKEHAQQLAIQSLEEKEQMIVNQNRILEEKVKQRTVELESINENLEKQRAELEKSNTLKDRLFSVISHDLRSPLVSLYSFVELMQMKNLSPEAVDKFLSKLKESLNNTNAMLDNVLYWALSQLNRLKIRYTDTSVRFITKELLQLYRDASSQKQIELVNNIPEDLVINTDPDIIKLVLRNLISNAIKYTPKGGKVVVGAERDETHYHIYVSDNGIGMSEEQIKSLFTEMNNRSTAGTANEKGTGIGLTLCSEYITKIKGRIDVETQVDKGSTFTITLPVKSPEFEHIES